MSNYDKIYVLLAYPNPKSIFIFNLKTKRLALQLIKQVKLHFKDNKSDKVYEVELYHIQDNEYVVNFRYGRRGGNLKEGTKTVFPVQKEKADKVFDDLVTSKTKKGYREVQNYEDTVAQPSIQEPVFEKSGARSVVLAYLNQRAQGEVLNTNWKLSRIIWRAGELEMANAIPAIKTLLPTLQGQEIYSAVWTLGRIANQEALEALKTIPYEPQALHYKIHVGAQLNAGDDRMISAIKDSLPPKLNALYTTKAYDVLQEELIKDLSLKGTDAKYLLAFYYLSINDPSLKRLLNKVLLTVPVIPGKWRYLRYIYKVAEMIKDGDTFGLIARLVNLNPNFFTRSKWSDYSYVGGSRINVKEALASNEPKLAFSRGTKEYFIKRSLRRLRKAGIDKMEAYCEFATGILIAYQEQDQGNQYEQNIYNYDWGSRTHSTTTHTYPPMTHVPYFYYILFSQGTRFEIRSFIKRFYSTTGIGEWSSREDSFSELWDRYPKYAVKILTKCRQRDAMNFAFKVLEGRADVEHLLTWDVLMEMITHPFEEVLEFSLEYIRKKYDSANPKVEVISQLIASDNERAVGLAVELLEKNSAPFVKNVEFIKVAILSKQESIHLWLRQNIVEKQLSENEISEVVDHCLNTFKNSEIAQEQTHPSETLVAVFPNHLKQLDAQIILEFIAHPKLEVQLFGAKLLNLNERKADEWPSEVLLKLLTSEHQGLREEGAKLLSRLSDEQLIEKTDFITELAASSHEDLRVNARQLIGRLASKNKEFGNKVLFGLYDVLLDLKDEEVLSQDIFVTIEMHLLPFISILNPELEEMLLSNNLEIHLLTNHLLESADINKWSVERIAKLGAHDMLEIRERAHRYFEANPDKVKYEKFEAINILDTDWEETRKFARDYFDANFTEREWEPSLVIALCDNIRSETQEYGTRILGKYFKEEHGVKYLTALSEHPDPIIELYSTNYLNQYAFNNQVVLDKLKPYFIRSLSAINTRRVAKKRVFYFLKKQAVEGDSYAKYVVDILNELVGTLAIQDNENYVSLLLRLKEKYPELEVNVERVPLEIR